MHLQWSFLLSSTLCKTAHHDDTKLFFIITAASHTLDQYDKLQNL